MRHLDGGSGHGIEAKRKKKTFARLEASGDVSLHASFGHN